MRRPLVFGLFAIWLSTGPFFLGPPLFHVEPSFSRDEARIALAAKFAEADEVLILARDEIDVRPAETVVDCDLLLPDAEPGAASDESASVLSGGHAGAGRPSTFVSRSVGAGGRGGGGLGQGGGGGGAGCFGGMSGGRGRVGLFGRLAPASLIVVNAQGAATFVFPLTCTVASADVAGWFASTRMTQTFANPLETPMEATYVFPLPTTAAVCDFEMRMGSRRVVGLVRRRAEAERLYAEALARGRTASLLTQERVNVFTQKVGNIPPRSSVDVAVTYFHPLAYDHGEFEYVFPMTVGPRYCPASMESADVARVTPPSGGDEAARGGREVAVHVVLEAGAPIEAIASPSHGIVVSREGRTRAVVDLARRGEVPNRDFVLRWRVAADSLRGGCVAHRAPDGTGYFSAFLVPPLDSSDAEHGPREATFLIDASGSMAGAPFETLRTFVRRALGRLRGCDRFALIRFGGSIDSFAQAPVAATRENVERAGAWLDACAAGGGTEMLPAVARFAQAPADARFERVVGFVTDGFVGNEEEILAAIRGGRGDARWFAFGIGSSVNRAFVEGVAAEGRGVADVVLPGETDAATRSADRFLDRIESPLLSDLRVDPNGLPVADVSPERPADLFAGSPIYVVGRYTSPAEGDLLFRGTVAGRAFAFPCHVVLPEVAPAREELAPMWARERIAEWTAQMRGAAPERAAELRETIERTALERRLASAATSFVCVDEDSFVAGEAVSVALPVEPPADTR